MSEIFGSTIMDTVNSLSSVDSDDYDEAFESIMDDYDEFIENTVDSMAGIATEGCCSDDDDCDCCEVDLSEDGEDIAEDDDDFYNTEDDLGIEEMEIDDEASEVDLSETSEYDDDDDAFESVGGTDISEDSQNGTVNQYAITTIYAEDNDPSSASVDDIILDDDFEIDDDDDEVSSDDADDELELDDDANDVEFDEDEIENDDDSLDLADESAQTFDDITKTFNSVLDSLE